MRYRGEKSRKQGNKKSKKTKEKENP
jgi:hypothetical protein